MNKFLEVLQPYEEIVCVYKDARGTTIEFPIEIRQIDEDDGVITLYGNNDVIITFDIKNKEEINDEEGITFKDKDFGELSIGFVC